MKTNKNTKLVYDWINYTLEEDYRDQEQYDNQVAYGAYKMCDQYVKQNTSPSAILERIRNQRSDKSGHITMKEAEKLTDATYDLVLKTIQTPWENDEWIDNKQNAWNAVQNERHDLWE